MKCRANIWLSDSIYINIPNPPSNITTLFRPKEVISVCDYWVSDSDHHEYEKVQIDRVEKKLECGRDDSLLVVEIYATALTEVIKRGDGTRISN